MAKQALPPAKCGKYASLANFVYQIVWLSQALAMFVECSYSGRYTADIYWKTLEGAGFTFIF
jgi:hypothetical protein